jgi:hypothetical protein
VVKVAVWRFRRGITVNGKVTQMQSRYRWRDRCGKELPEAADALIVKTVTKTRSGPRMKQVLERQL